jgi:hypothetical protein
MIKRVLVVLLLLALGACSKDDAQAKPGQGPAPADDALIAAWKKAGLEVSPLTDVDAAAYAAQKCRGGTVSGVDVVVCTYDTGEDASAAEDAALATLEKSGVTTASAIPRGKSLLIVSDKRKSDPSGRTINAITAAFRK